MLLVLSVIHTLDRNVILFGRIGRSSFLSLGNCFSFLTINRISHSYFSFSFSEICDFNFSSNDADIAFPFVNRTFGSEDTFPFCTVPEKVLFFTKKEGSKHG